MIKMQELKNCKALKDHALNTQIKHPLTLSLVSLSDLSKEYTNNQAAFIAYANKELHLDNAVGLFVAYDEQIMAIKKLTKLEILLLIDIINNKQGKMNEIKAYIYFADYNNETTFCDAIHQLLIKNTLMQANYHIEINKAEIDSDNEMF